MRRSLVLLTALCGCAVFAPAETKDERARVEHAGEPFSTRHEARELPALPDGAPLGDVLAYAFRSNADLEMSYFEWAAALERVPQESSLPDPSLSFEYLFASERMGRWDRTTLGGSQMIPYPAKLTRAGEVALADAVAARHRLEDRKFSLQAEVAAAWYELWLVDRGIEIGAENLALLQQFASVTHEIVAVGRAPQSDASKAELEVASADNELQSLRARRSAALAAQNALLSRPAAAPLRPAPIARDPHLPDDATILALAGERNPELAALAAEARGREDAVELARLAYVPDLSIGLDVPGAMDRSLMGMINVPLQFARIRAGIAESRAAQRSAEAALRARKDELGARMALELFLARDSDRQLSLFRDVLLPRARDVVTTTEMAYATGRSSFIELLDAQRSLLELELAAAELQATRATAVAALEALCALDFEALAGGAP